MKKLLVKPILALLFVASAAVLSAGSLDYLSNQSAGFYINMAAVSATDGAEIVPYNPAGTALMDKGFYLDISNQTLFKFYDQSEDAKLKEDYSLRNPTPSLPSLAAVYNFGKLGAGNLSVYLNGGICAGGGTLDWSDGTIGTNAYPAQIANQVSTHPTSPVPTSVRAGSSSSLVASSVYYGLGAGVGYSFFEDKLSASAGVRYVMAKRTGAMEASMNFTSTLPGPTISNWTLDADYEYTQEARGFTPIFGFDARPIKGLTLGLRYEMETELEFEWDIDTLNVTGSGPVGSGTATTVKASLNKDGQKFNQNLPQVISFGAEYDFTSAFTMSLQSTVYLINQADLNGMEDDFSTGYEVAVSGRYAFNEKFLLGGSVMYTESGAKDSYYESYDLLTVSANPPLDSLMFGLGAKYMVFKNFNVLLSSSYVDYLAKDVTTDSTGLEITYKKQVFNVGIGASYNF